MTDLVLTTLINAPPQRCFDLARSMDFHTASFAPTGERIVGGRAAGLIGLHEEVEFEARHLGLTRRLRARISTFEPPHRFVDEQMKGPFRALRHEHLFEPAVESTRMTDRITIDVAWGWLGTLIERIVIAPHLRKLLTLHQAHLKSALEGEGWTTYLR